MSISELRKIAQMSLEKIEDKDFLEMIIRLIEGESSSDSPWDGMSPELKEVILGRFDDIDLNGTEDFITHEEAMKSLKYPPQK